MQPSQRFMPVTMDSMSTVQRENNLAPEEKLTMDELFQIYRLGIRYLKLSCFQLAEKFLASVIPFFGTHPLLWVRLTESICKFLFGEHSNVKSTKFINIEQLDHCKSDFYVGGRKTEHMICKVDFHRDLKRAEKYISMACALVQQYPNDQVIKKVTWCWAAYVALRQGRCRDARVYCNGIQQLNTSSVIPYATRDDYIQMQCAWGIEGLTDKAALKEIVDGISDVDVKKYSELLLQCLDGEYLNLTENEGVFLHKDGTGFFDDEVKMFVTTKLYRLGYKVTLEPPM